MLTKKHTILILTILYFSLFFGVYLNDSLGGAFQIIKDSFIFLKNLGMIFLYFIKL